MSALSGARQAARAEKSALKGKGFGDSFQNFAAKVGVGTGNISDFGSYGFNPITRIPTLLEWMHRGSWICGLAVDIIPDDSTKGGVELLGGVKSDEAQKIEEAITALDIWGQANECMKWGRLYGGAIGVFMVKGQNYATPLNVDTIGKGQFKGILPLDRWMVDPSLNDLVTEEGPNIGKPKFYTVNDAAPGLRGQKIHHSRVLRVEGIKVPFRQRLNENLWSISVLERLYDRLQAFDSATAGGAQLIYKSYIRTYSIDGLRDIIAAGGEQLNGLVKWVETMRMFQGIEGITLLDGKDKMEAATQSNFAGLSDALIHLGQQISGALQIPLVRLFGQSPAGLNSSGESDLKTYYDGIHQQQNLHLLLPMSRVYRMTALSEGIKPPQGFGIKFRSLWQPKETEKSTMATDDTNRVQSAVESGLVSPEAGVRELRAMSAATGRWGGLTDEDEKLAGEELAIPEPEKLRVAEVKGEDPKQEGQTGQEPGTAPETGAKPE